MTPVLVEPFPVLIIIQMVRAAEQNFVDLSTQGMTNPLKKFGSYLIGEFHARLISIKILYPLSARYHAKGHECTGQCSAGLTVPGYPSCQGTPGHEAGFVSDVEFLLQTCKHGL